MSSGIVSSVRVAIEQFGFVAEASGAIGIVAVTLVTIAFIVAMVLIALNASQ